MAKKLKLKLDGLKNQVKTGIVKIKYYNGEVDYPVKIKDDRTYRNIISLSDYKYRTKLEKDKLVPTTLQKISNIKAEYRDIIMNSEGYTSKDISYVKIYDEKDLLLAKNDREIILEGISVVGHLDLEYIIDEKEGTTFLDLINSTFKDIIQEKYGVDEVQKDDYYKITEILYEANLLSYDVIGEFLVHIRSIKMGTPIEEERYRLEAINMGLNSHEIEEWIKVRKKENDKNLLNDSGAKNNEYDDVEIIE